MEKKITVLICDDHALFREGVKTVLSAQPDIEVVGGDLGRRETCLTVSELNESGDLGSGQRPSHVDPHLRCAGRSQILCHEGEDPRIHIPFQAKVEGRAAEI